MAFPQCVLVLLLSAVWAGSAPPPGYYVTAEGKSGRQLRQALHNIVTNALVVDYDETTDIIKTLDQDPSNTANVVLIYSGVSTAKTNFGPASGWNREHVWPRSYGIEENSSAYSDLHNLHACDSTVNSSRGDKYFDESWISDPNFRAPAHIEAPGCSSDSNSWEPRASEKGNVARILFYMDVRYEGTHGETNLMLTSDSDSITSSGTRMGRLEALLLWHALDPVDESERLRNEDVARFQQNRNPFVDHPEWADLIFRPLLRVDLDSGTIRLTWEDTFDALLQSRGSVTGAWTTITDGAVNGGGEWRMNRPATNGTELFRLWVR